MRYLLILLAFAFPAFAGTLNLNTCTNGASVAQTVVDGVGNVTLVCGSGPPPPHVCPPPTTVKGSTGNAPGAYQAVVLAAGTVGAYKLPMTPSGTGKYVKPSIIWNTGTPDDLRVDMALSECPNELAVAPKCFQNGPVSGFSVRGDSVPVGGTSQYYCPLTEGKQYYVNVKPTNCQTPTCTFYLQYNGNF